MTGKKLRQSPVARGITSLGICLKNPVVEETTLRFMKALGYRGILDIGYRYDARDGQYKLLDVNPRIGCTFRLFVAENGMDTARALYLDLTGQPVPPSTSREGRKWLVEMPDLKSSIEYYRLGKLTLRQWADSFSGVQETAQFAWDDPWPFVDMCAQSGLNHLRRLFANRWERRKSEAATALEAEPGA
jgi:predicted ATP-grasp superfamily ATP-dependent carboligase